MIYVQEQVEVFIQGIFKDEDGQQGKKGGYDGGGVGLCQEGGVEEQELGCGWGVCGLWEGGGQGGGGEKEQELRVLKGDEGRGGWVGLDSMW